LNDVRAPQRSVGLFRLSKALTLMNVRLSSAKAALLVIAYNCLVLPVAAVVLVFAWRVAIGSIYGYAKYEPINLIVIFLLAAVVAEIILAANLSDVRNVRGILMASVFRYCCRLWC
jgi:hypothetical protein